MIDNKNDIGRENHGVPNDVTTEADHPAFLAGGGEMGRRMRSYDWSASPLGPATIWPQSLQTAVRIVLTSRFAMWMAWGPELTFFCNDAYLPTVGLKRDWVLGARSDTVWEEIWPDIGPRIDRVLATGDATWDEALLLFLERSGFAEETYHTFSYSPLADDAGTIVGMLCVVTEETERVVGERRLRVLRDLALRMAETRMVADVWTAVERSVAAEPKDFPFTLAYDLAADGTNRLVSATGIPIGHPLAPEVAVPGGPHAWPLDRVAATGQVELVTLEPDIQSILPSYPWDRPSRLALVAPVTAPGHTRPVGAFVVGLNPYRPAGAVYRGFIDLFVNQIAAGLANADAYEAERRRAEALAEVDRAKTAFFSNVSHEFRTPLTLMLGPLEDVLGRGDAAMAPQDRDALQVVHRNGLRLLRLVNGLLDFARIEAGRAQAQFEPTDLATLTADLASSFRSATERAGLVLRIDCPAQGAPVFVDRDMWEKIVLNLLSNAFKFTFDGTIDIALRQGPDEAVLTIADTGTGIPDAELPRLFERFHRVEGAKGRSFEGSGIGLALVQELVHLHQGRIAVTSAMGVGTTFTIAVPLGNAHLPAERIRTDLRDVPTAVGAQSFVEEALRWLPDELAPDVGAGVVDRGPSPPVHSPALGGGLAGRVLLADDNADLRAYIARLLSERGYDVDAVGDGDAALQAARASRPDLLLTDVMMPGLDGAGLLRAVRDDPALRDLPVIMLSARAGEEAELEGIGSGADDYLTKPFSARELLARVGANISMARMRRDATAALAESEARFRNMADHAPVMMWVTDPAGQCTYLNNAWYAFTGQVEPDPPTFDWLAALHPEDRARVVRAFMAATASQSIFRMEYRLLRHDGAPRWVVAAAAPRVGGEGEGGFLGYIGSVIDIHDRVEAEATLEGRVADEVAGRSAAEEALRQAQKMEAVGQLTGGLAHDFNNLLTSISGSLELMQTRLAQGRIRDLDRYIAAAQGASKRAAALTHRLLAFSRRQTLDPKPTDANRLVAGMEDLISRTVGPAIDIEVVGTAGLWTTLVDPGQLESALLNLCINARDAMPDGGRITIETANRWMDQATAEKRDLAPGQYISLSVSDTGTGMTPEVAARAFDPFFTTKPIGQGTGLGLSMIYGFARQSGGQVRIYSEVGQGSTICIYLPRHDGPESPEDAAEVRVEPSPGDGETVLVIDDEAAVRMLVVDVLEELGYVAIEAPDGHAGLKILQSPVRIDLLVTDVGLPGGMNGRQVADAARALRPGLKILFITGYAENAAIGNGHLEPGMHVLTKPFAMDALLGRIKALIEA